MTDLRAAILNAQDIQSEQVDVPEWGVMVEVRGMTGEQRAHFMEACITESGKAAFDVIYPEILIACTFDPESGQPVFQATDRAILNTKAAAATERIAKVAMRLSGMDEDAKAVPNVEAAKNA